MKRHVPVKGRKGVYFSETVTGKVYEVRYTDSDHRNVFKTIGPRLQDALDFQADIRVRLGKGERVVATTKPFSEVAREWERYRLGTGTTLAANTVKTYKSHLNNHILPQFQNRKVGKITTDMIYLWLRDLPLSGGTRQGIYIVLNDIMGFASSPRRGYISNNPCKDLEKGELPRPDKFPVRILLPEEAESLLAACTDTYRSIFQTGMLSGLRIAEVLGLQWDEVDFRTNYINVRCQLDRHRNRVPTKGGKHREVPLFPALRQILFGMPSRFTGGYVFTDKQGKPRNYAVVSEAFKRARVKAGLSENPRPVRIHDLRHTFASALLMDGQDVAWVSRMLGHTSSVTTLTTYHHVINRKGRLEEGSERLAAALGPWAR